MERKDDFEKRRVEKGIADLTDKELYDRFWELTAQVVDPLVELGYRHTTPSIERSVLLRMGISSLDTQKIVKGCIDNGLIGHGAGHVVYKISKLKGISIPEAGKALSNGEYWEDAVAAFSKGGK
jgi:D-ornithine 4,5-aminomutase subunit alpha